MGSHGMLAIVNDETEATRRRAPRTRVLLSCTLVTTTDEYRVKLRNVSASGAMMEGAKLPPQGSDVMLRRGASEAFATVAWADGTRGGLAFDEPLGDLAEWTHVPAPAAPIAPPVPAQRPGFRPARLTPEEQAIARAWANPQGRPSFGE